MRQASAEVHGFRALGRGSSWGRGASKKSPGQCRGLKFAGDADWINTQRRNCQICSPAVYLCSCVNLCAFVNSAYIIQISADGLMRSRGLLPSGAANLLYAL